MPLSAWIMLILGCVVLYGGLLFGIYRAIRRKVQWDGWKKE